MSNLKDLLRTFESGDSTDGDLEVYADSVRQGLQMAAKELGVDISLLDYEVLERGKSGLFGIGRLPFKLAVRAVHEDAAIGSLGLNELDSKLTASIKSEIVELEREDPNAPGSFKVRVTKSGIWLIVSPSKGSGRQVQISEVAQRLDQLHVKDFDQELVKKTVRDHSGRPVRLGDWIPNIENDGTMYVEISDDQMRALVHFEPPRFSGRHMELDDVVQSLKNSGIVVGIDEEAISKYLDAMNYVQPLVAARGVQARYGTDAYVEYKVRIEKHIEFDNDEASVDFKDLNLIENVVIGQLLAVKVPATKGVEGRTVTNQVTQVKPGKDIAIKHGPGTILSDDGIELTAERNGQVVMKVDQICVDEVYVVQGDVNNTTGNITMLGSVLVTGNVLDEFIVKASGNIEVRGSVQKAVLEAEGDIIVRQGINGRDEGRIETTGGSVYAKFVQRANVIAEKNIFVTEELLLSNADAGNLILCNGKRAQIVGGLVRAGDEVNARMIGSESNTKTVVCVGVNPKILQQMSNLEKNYTDTTDELEKIDLDISTLESRQRTTRLTDEQKERYASLKERKEKLSKRKEEISLEMQELKDYLEVIEQKGRVCAEKKLFPGVEIVIKNNKLRVQDMYSDVSITLKNNDWAFGAYIPPEGFEDMITSRKRRR